MCQAGSAKLTERGEWSNFSIAGGLIKVVQDGDAGSARVGKAAGLDL